MGAGGRDFHDFAVALRDDPAVEVVAFTAAQIPGIDDRRFPAALAGPRYPDGIPIRPEAELAALVREHAVDEVVLAYSDLAHVEVMHRAALVGAAGADFRLLGPRATMLRSTRPVIAVCATRTGCGKSQTSRRVAEILRDAGRRVVLVRHPMPYGDLEAMRVQRFATIADVEAAHPTVEEREEYEAPVRAGFVMYAGVDYEAILHAAESEADVIVWDGGNNDLPFFRPDLHVTVTDALRPGHETAYHPGETNLLLADVVVVNKVDAARPADVAGVEAAVRARNQRATVVRAASPCVLAPGPDLRGARVLAVDDGPTLTHGGMSYGAGMVAAWAAGAVPVDPRPWAVGSIEATFARHPHLGPVLPAMGYGDAQLAELAATIEAVPCDSVVAGTPIALERVVVTRHPIRRVTYAYADAGSPTLADVLEPFCGRLTSSDQPVTTTAAATTGSHQPAGKAARRRPRANGVT
jgi:predicted GTPase